MENIQPWWDVLSICREALDLFGPLSAGPAYSPQEVDEQMGMMRLDLAARIDSVTGIYLAEGVDLRMAIALNAEYLAALSTAADQLEQAFAAAFRNVRGDEGQLHPIRKALWSRYVEAFEQLKQDTAKDQLCAIKKHLSPSVKPPCEPTAVLETAYSHCTHPTPAEKERLARACGLTARQVNTWFANHRQRKGAIKSGSDKAASSKKRHTSTPRKSSSASVASLASSSSSIQSLSWSAANSPCPSLATSVSSSSLPTLSRSSSNTSSWTESPPRDTTPDVSSSFINPEYLDLSYSNSCIQTIEPALSSEGAHHDILSRISPSSNWLNHLHTSDVDASHKDSIQSYDVSQWSTFGYVPREEVAPLASTSSNMFDLGNSWAAPAEGAAACAVHGSKDSTDQDYWTCLMQSVGIDTEGTAFLPIDSSLAYGSGTLPLPGPTTDNSNTLDNLLSDIDATLSWFQCPPLAQLEMAPQSVPVRPSQP